MSDANCGSETIRYHLFDVVEAEDPIENEAT